MDLLEQQQQVRTTKFYSFPRIFFAEQYKKLAAFEYRSFERLHTAQAEFGLVYQFLTRLK